MISIFTITHKPEKLLGALASLKVQTDQNFEWIILVNNTEEKVPTEVFDYEKARVIYSDAKTDKIGYLKNLACKHCKGGILLELDHDDLLEPNCIQRVKEEFENPEIDFVYSSTYHYRDGKTEMPFSFNFGWSYVVEDDKRITTKAFPPSPVSFGYIWYAPNHVRAWKRDFYERIGGHNVEYDVCDDHELMLRTYVEGNVSFIDEPLYQYHVTTGGDNTCYGEKNAKIQRLTVELHDQYIEALCLKWSKLNNLEAYDLCCHETKRAGFKGVDRHEYKGVDLVMDLDKPWDIPDNSVGVFRLMDAIEHMKDPIHTMKELYRCLAPGGFALIEVPSTDGRGAFQDPTHVSFWNSNSFWYYTRQDVAKYINTPVKFQLNRIVNYFPSKWHEDNNIPYTRAHLVKLADGMMPAGGREI